MTGAAHFQLRGRQNTFKSGFDRLFHINRLSHQFHIGQFQLLTKTGNLNQAVIFGRQFGRGHPVVAFDKVEAGGLVTNNAAGMFLDAHAATSPLTPGRKMGNFPSPLA